jgi:enamine deaminase RidA (YjgF/YER057c/UK114 family)
MIRPTLFFAILLANLPAFAATPYELFDVPDAPYSAAAKAMSGGAIYFSSGNTPGPDAGDDMRSQALATLKRLQQNIADAGLTPDDVAFVRAYLVPGPDGTTDYAGWNAAWSETFKTHKPARSTVAVPLLGRPGTLIEIEFVCLPASNPQLFASSAKLGLPQTNPRIKPYGTKEGRIYAGMGVLPSTAMYWTAGITPPVLDDKLPPTDRGRRGDMKTQARNTLLRLQENLAGVGLSFKDVVYLRAFLAPDAHLDGKFDYDGWNAAYAEFFNTADNPHKPARTTVTTPTFGDPTMLIEIEIVAAFPATPALFDREAANPQLKAYGDPKAMIASGIAVNAPASLLFSAAAVPTRKGDLKTQAISTLESLAERLGKAGLSFKDVVFLRAYVVPNADGNFDRAGWSAAYGQYFNNATQPHKPARTTIPVTSLPNPEWNIAIDVVAVAPR